MPEKRSLLLPNFGGFSQDRFAFVVFLPTFFNCKKCDFPLNIHPLVSRIITLLFT
jgi:hypothetical protein